MTMTFWLPLMLLIILALIFVMYPMVFFQPRKDRIDQRQQNLETYRSRMREMDAEYDNGNMDSETYEKLKVELEASLLDDVGDPATVDEQSTSTSGRSTLVAVTLAAVVFVPVFSYVFYERYGFQEDVAQFREMQEMSAEAAGDPQQMLALVENLRERLEEEPDHVEGWAVLGQTNMQLQRYAQAASAFRNLAEAAERTGEGDEAQAWGMAAQADFLQSQGQVTPSVREAIEQARSLNPDEVNALGLLGIDAFQQGNFRQALEHWERIVAIAPDHPQLPSIRQGIAAAYSELGEPVPEDVLQTGQADVMEPEVDVEGTRVETRVELSDEATADVNAEDTVFVYARALDGPPRPLAISRLRVDNLPTSVTLDTTMGMTENGELEAGASVMLVARVSRDGNATPQPGDWEGETGPVIVGAQEETAEIIIGEPVR